MTGYTEYFGPLMFTMTNLVVPMLVGITGIAVLCMAILHKSEQQSSPEHKPLIVAFCFLGVILGGIAGGSSTPLGETLVTGILGVITALLTYLLGKHATSNWRIFIPYAMVALLISAFVGLIVGANYKAINMSIQEQNDPNQQRWDKFYESVMIPMCLKENELLFAGMKPSSEYPSQCREINEAFQQ